jgi:cardiolipin synthase
MVTDHRPLLGGGGFSLSNPGKDLEDQFFRKTLENVGQTSFLTGNSIQVLKDGHLAFEEVFRAVEEAERFICLDFYIFRDDETGWGLAELLARKREKGVQVWLIYDHFGCLFTSSRFWKFLKSHGVEVLPFHPFRWTNPNLYFHRDHRKLVVIDGWVGFTGGLNVGDEYRGYLRKKLAGWRDTGVTVKGPIAGVMLDAFKKSWKECGGRAIEENLKSQGGRPEQNISMLPLFSSSRKSMRILRQMLQFSVHAAQKSIHFTMAYFIPTHKFLRVLLKAARRGVDVKIILPGQSDLRLVAYVSRTYYKTLLREGVKIFHYQPRVLHAKTMVFDGHWSIVGSANLDSRSLNYNYECGVGILDRAVGEEMERIFAQDLLDSGPITEGDLLRWPFHERVLGNFFSWFRSYL